MLVLQCVAVATIPQRVYVVGAAYRGEITAYEDGETRDIVIQVTNTGNEDLVNVVLTDETQSGVDIENLVWTLPNGETIEATTNDDGVLTATWDGPWAPEEVITGVATLTLPLGDELHTNLATVTADGAISGEPVEDDDPYNGTPPPAVPAIDVIKNDEGDDVHEVQAGEHDVTVTITNDGNEALENFEFTDTTEEGQDVVWNEEDLAALEELTLEPGESFTVNGTVQVAAGETHRDNAVVTADGVISGEPVEDQDPTTYEGDPTYAIGDYVWIDENRDGIQDDEESPLDGVTVVLYDGEGEELDRTTTDENGRYIFDNLPEGEYQVGFQLTEEQERLYNFTDYTEGDDPAEDSNAGDNGRSEIFTLGPDSSLTSNEGYEHFEVEASEGIDPTWDAGVQLKPYAIGDYVWIDANNDGIQDEDEEPLSDVTVVLYNNDGVEIDRTTTDENGRYIFDTLNAGEYQVRFILTDEQAEIYEFTDYRAGSDTQVDSNAGYSGFSATIVLGPDNQFLTSNEDYEYGTVLAPLGIDPTWDAGVVLISPEDDETPPPTDEPSEPTEDPSDPSEPSDPAAPGDDPTDPADPAGSGSETPGDRDGVLSATGANLALIFGALGLLLLVTGGALYARHRKGSEA